MLSITCLFQHSDSMNEQRSCIRLLFIILSHFLGFATLQYRKCVLCIRQLSTPVVPRLPTWRITLLRWIPSLLSVLLPSWRSSSVRWRRRSSTVLRSWRGAIPTLLLLLRWITLLLTVLLLRLTLSVRSLSTAVLLLTILLLSVLLLRRCSSIPGLGSWWHLPATAHGLLLILGIVTWINCTQDQLDHPQVRSEINWWLRLRHFGTLVFVV